MLTRPRLRSLDGCATCKIRRKKCDETKPRCGACQRLELRCLWQDDKNVTMGGLSVRSAKLPDGRSAEHIRPDPILNPGPDLSAFTGLMCGTYVLEKCYDGFNSPLNVMWTSQNDTTIRSTLSFAPAEDSLAWGCIVGQGMMMIGNRYHNRRLIEAGILQQGVMLRKISAAIADEDKRHHLDTVAAIDNLFMSTATTVGFTKPGVSDEMSCHVVGFSNIVNTMQPEQFQDERALALFEHVRLSKIMVSLMLKHETVLTSYPWRTVPWATATRTKSSAQRLIDLLCDVASLQAGLKTAFPYSKPNLGIDQGGIWKKVGQLLSDLNDWRQPIEAEIKESFTEISDSVIDDSSSPTGTTSQSYPKGTQLYELGIFNLLLIYLCQFLTRDRVLLDTVNVFACKKAQHKSSQKRSQSLLLSPSVLPLSAPDDRIRTAAIEILMICEWVHDEGKDGLMLAYLAIPMRVAQGILADVGDVRSVRLGELLIYLSEFWSGRSR